MSISDTLLPEFDQEMATTRRLLERVPTDKGKWKLHPKSFPLGHLTQLVSMMPGWITNAVTQTELNLGDYPGYTYEKTEDLLAADDQPSRSPSRSAHGLSTLDRCPDPVYLWTDRGREDAGTVARLGVPDNERPLRPCLDRLRRTA
jgi:hypothetical protein